MVRNTPTPRRVKQQLRRPRVRAKGRAKGTVNSEESMTLSEFIHSEFYVKETVYLKVLEGIIRMQQDLVSKAKYDSIR